MSKVVRRLEGLAQFVTKILPGLTHNGRAVSFLLQPNVTPTEAMTAVIAALRPAYPATAEMLNLDYLRFSCRRHTVGNAELLMAPGLEMDNLEALKLPLLVNLEKIGLPYILPEKARKLPVAILEGIRLVCRQLGFYAQGVNLRAQPMTACPVCRPLR